MVTIRRGEEMDIKGIMELLDQVLYVHHVSRPDLFRKTGSKYTPDELKEILHDDNRPVFVAVDSDGNVAGHIFCIMEKHFGPSQTGFNSIYIDDLCVDEKCRGEHVGEELYNYVLDYARDHDCYNVTLHVWEGNDEGKGFYEKMGMKPYMTGMEVIL